MSPATERENPRPWRDAGKSPPAKSPLPRLAANAGAGFVNMKKRGFKPCQNPRLRKNPRLFYAPPFDFAALK